MVRHKSKVSLTDTRSVLATTGDITVGAYARQQRRRRAAMAVFGLALIGGAVSLYFVLRPQDGAVLEQGFPIVVHCVECGYDGIVRVELGQGSFPMTCPQCGEHSCQQVWECRVCGRQFLRKSGAAELRCPFCRSRAVGTAEVPKGVTTEE